MRLLGQEERRARLVSLVPCLQLAIVVLSIEFTCLAIAQDQSVDTTKWPEAKDSPRRLTRSLDYNDIEDDYNYGIGYYPPPVDADFDREVRRKLRWRRLRARERRQRGGEGGGEGRRRWPRAGNADPPALQHDVWPIKPEEGNFTTCSSAQNCYRRRLNPGKRSCAKIKLNHNQLACGESPALTPTRIVGGSHPPVGKYPFAVKLLADKSEVNRTVNCGGSLISPRHVLTAAHCVEKSFVSNITVIMGATNYTDLLECATVARVAQVFIHYNYNNFMDLNDIAIIELDRDVEFNFYQDNNGNVNEVCWDRSFAKLVARDHSPLRRVLLTGWGKTGWSEDCTYKKASKALKVEEFVVQRSSFCELNLEYFDSKSQFCMLKENYRSSSKGDSGSPYLVEFEPNRFIQVGLVQGGPTRSHETLGCMGFARATKLAPYITWIRCIVNEPRQRLAPEARQAYGSDPRLSNELRLRLKFLPDYMQKFPPEAFGTNDECRRLQRELLNGRGELAPADGPAMQPAKVVVVNASEA